MSLTNKIISRGLDVNAFTKFIEAWRDRTETRGGCFDMSWGTTLMTFNLLDGIIVYCTKSWEYSDTGTTGIGHEVTVSACNQDRTRFWECMEVLDYRDMHSAYKDRPGAWPKEFLSITKSDDSKILKVDTLMGSGEHTFLKTLQLKERSKE